jgi:hypothetical protein
MYVAASVLYTLSGAQLYTEVNYPLWFVLPCSSARQCRTPFIFASGSSKVDRKVIDLEGCNEQGLH